MSSPFTVTDTASEISNKVLAPKDDRRRLFLARLVPTMQHRANTRRQLAKAERLGDVVVGAHFEPRDAIALARSSREHDDRGLRGVRSRPQDADDQIWRLVHDGLERRIAAGHRIDVNIAASLERVLDEACDIVLVFDDKNTGIPISAGHE